MRKTILGRTLIVAALLSAGSFARAETEQVPVPPACTGPAHHAFDFWLGSWRVTDIQGNYRGANEITPGPGGCGLIEHWHGVRGGEGTSLNSYDRTTGDWTQNWMSSTETIHLRGKVGKDGALRTTGTITSYNASSAHPFRGNWIPQPDGTVRQEFFEQDPRTKQWSNWFTGIYKRES